MKSPAELERDERLVRLEEANREVGLAFRDVLDDQGRKVATNLLMMFDLPKNASRFIADIEMAVRSTAYWLIADGYVTLNPEYVANDIERQAYDEEKAKKESSKLPDYSPSSEAAVVGPYL